MKTIASYSFINKKAIISALKMVVEIIFKSLTK